MSSQPQKQTCAVPASSAKVLLSVQKHFQDWYDTILIMDSSNSLAGLCRRRLNLEYSSMGGGLQGLLYSYTLPLQSQECLYSLSTQLHVLYFSNEKASFPILELLKRVHQCGPTDNIWSTCHSHFCNAYSWFGSLNANYKPLVFRRLLMLFLILTLHRRWNTCIPTHTLYYLC